MKSKFIVPALLTASLIAAPMMAFAQSGSAAPATEKSATAKPKHHRMKIAHRAHFRHGTTTGFNSRGAGQARPGGESVARKPAGE